MTSPDPAFTDGSVSPAGTLRGLASDSALYAVGNAIPKLSGIFLAPVYMRFLAPEDYGLVRSVSLFVSFCGVLFALGMSGSVLRFYYEYEGEERKTFYGTMMAIQTVNAAFLSLILLAAGRAVVSLLFKDVPFAPYFYYAIGTLFFAFLPQWPVNLFRARRRPLGFMAFGAAQFAVSAALMVYFVAVRKEGALGSVKATFYSSAAFFAASAFLIRREIGFRVNLEMGRKALTFSLPLVPHLLAVWGLNLMDQAFIERYRSLRELGHYAMAVNLASFMVVAMDAAAFAWTPLVLQKNAERPDSRTRLFPPLVTGFCAAMLTAALGLAALRKEAFYVLATPEYYPSAQVVVWLTVGLFFKALYYVPADFLFLVKRTGALPAATGAAAAVNFALNFLLIPRWGMHGAAIATAFSYFFMLGLTFLQANRYFPVPYEYGKILCLTAAAAAAFFLCEWVGAQPGLAGIARSLLIKPLIIAGVPALAFVLTRKKAESPS